MQWIKGLGIKKVVSVTSASGGASGIIQFYSSLTALNGGTLIGGVSSYPHTFTEAEFGYTAIAVMMSGSGSGGVTVTFE